MSWTASAVISLPKKLSKRAILIVSLLALLTVLANMIMFSYIQYVSAYKMAKNYINAEHEIMYKDLSRGVATGDIYNVFTMIDAVASALPYIDNVVVYDDKGGYVADANVLRENIVSDIRNVGVQKDLTYGNSKAGSVIYYISRMAILEEVVMSISGLVMMNLLIVLTAALVGGYLSLRIAKPVIDLSQHLQDINAPGHKTLEVIKKTQHRRFRRKSEGNVQIYRRMTSLYVRPLKKRK
ncbi:MAG: hypothetical protein AB7E96_06560 [Deferribacterales bacterium]